MHIIIGILGSLVTIFYLLDRPGIDIGGLSAAQQAFIGRVRAKFTQKRQDQGTWS